MLLKSKENNLNEKFYGLLDSTLHWIFVKEKHLNIVISDANYLADKSKEEIYDLVIQELLQFASITRSDILKYKIIKEKPDFVIFEIVERNVIFSGIPIQ